MHERTIGLVGLDDVILARAALGVGIVAIDRTADDEARIKPHAIDGSRQHRGRRRLSVRTGTGKRLLALAERCERLGAMPDGNATLAGLDKLGVFLGDGARDDDCVEVAGEICRIVADHDLDARIDEALGGARLLHVRSADLHAT